MAKYSVEGMCKHCPVGDGQCMRIMGPKIAVEKIRRNNHQRPYYMQPTYPDNYNQMVEASITVPSQAEYVSTGRGSHMRGVYEEYVFKCRGRLRGSQTICNEIAIQKSCDLYEEGPVRRINFKTPPVLTKA